MRIDRDVLLAILVIQISALAAFVVGGAILLLVVF